ncbi:hypothetical protein HYW43_00215 [Candidatus Daviesbacteria bacterium]|nr:hypothetical protein [Candidatus Daviesbacteria bacterium]
MNAQAFLKIFHSNYPLNIDWANIDEIAWMYTEGLLQVSSTVLVSHQQFEKRLSQESESKSSKLREGESLTHLILKLFARDYLIKKLGVNHRDILFEYPLVGFEVDVIDRNLKFLIECGDTNALKLEKYLALPTTNKLFVLPYPQLEDLKIFEFSAKPRFFDYIKHKQIFLNRQNARFR